MRTDLFFLGFFIIIFTVGIAGLIVFQLAHALGWPVTIGIMINTTLTILLLALKDRGECDDCI